MRSWRVSAVLLCVGLASGLRQRHRQQEPTLLAEASANVQLTSTDNLSQQLIGDAQCAGEDDQCVEPTYCDSAGFITKKKQKPKPLAVTAVRCTTEKRREGMCCRKPPTLEGPVEVKCHPSAEQCVQPTHCNADGFVEHPTSERRGSRAQPAPRRTYSRSRYRGGRRGRQEEQDDDTSHEFCVKNSGEKGVCCRRPDRQAIEVYCAPNEDCVEAELCDRRGFVKNVTTVHRVDKSANQTEKLGPYGTFCLMRHRKRGVCCRYPDPKWPRYKSLPRCGRSFDVKTSRGPSYRLRDSDFGEISWHATILEKETGNFVCGGTIISSRHILTSDHCVEEHKSSEIHVRVGDYIIHDDSEPLPPQDIDVSSIRTHPLRGALFNDIAVLKLKKTIRFDAHVQPICMPRKRQKFTGRCVVSGWGKDAFEGFYSERMKRIELPMVELSDCEQKLRSETKLGDFFRLDKSVICAGGEKDADACRGDAGGALACPSADGHYVMAGVAAWSVGCGKEDVPSAFTSVEATFGFTRRYTYGLRYHPFFQTPPTPEELELARQAELERLQKERQEQSSG